MSLRSIKCNLLPLLAVFLTTGCFQNVYYVPVKDNFYELAPSNLSAIDSSAQEDSSAHYTSSIRATKERYQDPNILGNVHLKSSSDPDEESTVFAIRKEHRGYMAETPIMAPIAAGKRKITPNFSIGLHKDHKAMAGLTFRMPF